MAGGKGTRLNGIKARSFNKHALPVFDRPIIEHVVKTLVNGGVMKILVLLDGTWPQSIMEILEDGSRFGSSVEIFYRYICEGRSPGRDLQLAESWVGKDDFVLMLGDGLFANALQFTKVKAPHIWVMPLEGLDDPAKYAQVKLNGDQVIELHEKPKKKFSNLIQTGVWLFPPQVFEDVRKIAKAHKENDEVAIGLLSEWYVSQHRMTCTEIPPLSYIDIGTPEALHTAWKMMEKNSKQS